MNLTREWSITLAGFFSIAMLAALLFLVDTAPTHALGGDGELSQDAATEFNPTDLPPIDYTIWTTCHMCLNGLDGEPLVGIVFQADAKSDRDGLASGQISSGLPHRVGTPRCCLRIR